MTFIYLLFSTAFFLSTVAAYYSIVGLVAIFPTAEIPIMIMGISLELAKLVCASWLYRNWKSSARSMKYYFLVAVVTLSFITSMGIFGFLSKAHIDQSIIGADSFVELRIIDDEINSEKRRMENAQRSLNALDRLVDQSDTEAAIKLRNSQTGERRRLASEISIASSTIKDLSLKASPLRKESKRIAAEVGPIKYIADLIYGESSESTLEAAVRAVIILIVLVFDPLAIILLIAANRELQLAKKINKSSKIDRKTKKIINDYTYPQEDKNITVEKNKIYEIPTDILDKVFKRRK